MADDTPRTKTVAELKRDLRELAELLSEVEERMDSILYSYSGAEIVEHPSKPRPTPSPMRVRDVSVSMGDSGASEKAVLKIGQFEIETSGNHGKLFRLLGRGVAVPAGKGFSRADGRETVDLVPFKSADFLKEELSRQTGKSITRHNLQVMVSRLKKLLGEYRLDSLVESVGGGYRLRLEEPGVPDIQDDTSASA